MNSNESKTVRIIPGIESPGYLFEDGIFGVNLEITRKGFFGGLCAQMLNNRKLFMGEESVDGWICEGYERITNRPEESLCQSHFVILENGSMSQTSEAIALQAYREYEAILWIKAISDTVEITVEVADMKQTVSVSADDAPYKEISFIFSGKDVENGTFSLHVTGKAALFEVSLMPTDHFHGMRWDVIEALRRIAPTALRFPGGCAADHFDWKESLKAPEFRKPADGRSRAWFLFRDTYHQDPLDIGLNEFMLLCK